MNRKAIKILCSIAVFLCVLFQCFYVNASSPTAMPNSDFYVYDDYGILSSDTRNYIMSTNKSLYDKTGAQIVVALVKSLNGADIESYALNMFRSFGIGSREKNNGILLLCAINDGKVRMEVGYGLEGALPDSKVGRILDTYLIPKFKEKQYEQGIVDTYRATLSVVQKEYNISIDSSISVQDYEINDNSSKNAIIPLIILGIIIFIDLFFNRGRMIRSLATIIIFSGRNNGGGFGGGNSSGGGGFSGGGGSSGGGGASRGF